ncbi:hypothetical protein CLIB1423_16S02278 [[Candida] railenensis]|uniref:Uncharacterized protein n=1 Tax=[Candida] railenensis TaxID=45579 RepID=A0A9P0W0A4_9ASCO|nr:hypothetical protein CLIB1423_16S02278 [[Candida] railenensis]
MSREEVLENLNTIVESGLEFVLDNEEAIVISILVVCTTSIAVDFIRLKQENPKTSWKSIVSAFFPSVLATGAAIKYISATFPTTNQVLFLLAVLVSAKLSKWVDLERKVKPYVEESVLARLALKNYSRLTGWLNFVPNFGYYIWLLIVWEWLRRGDRVEDDRVKNISPVPNSKLSLSLELGSFAVILIDQLIYLKKILFQFKRKGVFGKFITLVYFLLAATFLSPPVSLISRRLKEEGVF